MDISKGDIINKTGTTLPTGFTFLDIMMGENRRDLNGNIVDTKRGFEMSGKQTLLAAEAGTGKSTLIGNATAFPFHIGMNDCVYKVIIIDTDNAAWSPQRLRKLTNLPLDVISDKYEIIQLEDTKELADTLYKKSEEYKKLKLKPVKYFDPFMGVERSMIPKVLIFIDTVSSITSVEDKDALDKIQNMHKNLDLTNLSNKLGDYFDGHCNIVWIAHLKENNPKPGSTAAPEKDFKSAPGNKTAGVPKKFRGKVTDAIYFQKVLDMKNKESAQHPIQIYGLQDLDLDSIYAVDAIAVKSRTGPEALTTCRLINIGGRFDHTMSLIASALVNDVIVEASGMHPNASEPSIFKDIEGAEHLYKTQGRRTKRSLSIPGYDRKTNVIELRLLLNYTGDIPFLVEEKQKLQAALNQAIVDTLHYELETNNLTQSDMDENNRKLQSLLGFMTKVV